MAGSAAMYHAMTSLGFASESPYKGPVKLQGDPKGASVLILGAGLAGMTAALELRKAGYKVQVLEFNSRAGGRNWTLRGGDSFTELGGSTQTCEFENGLYINPGPWRIPYHHRALLGLLQTPRRRARAVHPAQSQRAAPRLARVRRRAAADPRDQGGFSGTGFRAARESDASRASSTRPSPRKIRKSCCKRCGPGARSTATTNTTPIWSPRNSAATCAIPAAGFWPIRCRAIPSACPRC